MTRNALLWFTFALLVIGECPRELVSSTHQFQHSYTSISSVNESSSSLLLQLGDPSNRLSRMVLLVNSSEPTVVSAALQFAAFLVDSQAQKWNTSHSLDILFHCHTDATLDIGNYLERYKTLVQLMLELRLSNGGPLLTYPYDSNNHTIPHNDYRVLKRVALAYALGHPTMHHSPVCTAGICHGFGRTVLSSNFSLFDQIFQSSSALPFRVALGNGSNVFQDNHVALFSVFSMLWSSSVWGYVTSRATHLPISGATILPGEGSAFATITNQDGYYSRLISPEQDLNLVLSAENFLNSRFKSICGRVDVAMNEGTPEVTLGGILSVSLVFVAVLGLMVFFLCLNWKNKNKIWGASRMSPLDILEADFTDQGGDLELNDLQ